MAAATAESTRPAATLRDKRARPVDESHTCFHENGELSRHVTRGDQAAASRQIQQRSEAPLSFGDEHLCRREQRPAWRGKEGRHRPPNATSRAWQCLRSYGFSDRERDENCALAIAWKHAPATHARRSRTRSRTPLLLSQKARVRTCPILTRSSLALPPRSKRGRPGLRATAFPLSPARLALSQCHEAVAQSRQKVTVTVMVGQDTRRRPNSGPLSQFDKWLGGL